MEMPEIYPRRPYLLRAFYDELINSQLTPYLLVDNTDPNVKTLPSEQGCDGRVVLNLSPYAVENLQLGNHEVSFNASFNYIPYHVIVPMKAVLAIYAKENGEGMVFEKEAAYDVESKTISDNENPVTISSKLTLVANKDEGQQDDKSASDDDNPQPPRGANRPTLRVVK